MELQDFRASQGIPEGAGSVQMGRPGTASPKGRVCSDTARLAMQSSAYQSEAGRPIGEGHQVSDHTTVDLSSLSQKNVRQLKLEQAKLKIQNFFFSTILGRPVDPARTEALQTIDLLVRIREAVAQGNLDGKSPKELGELLHSLVAVNEKEPRAQLGLSFKGFGFVLSGMSPEKQAEVFREFFSQGKTYSPGELSSIKESLNQPSLNTIVDQEAEAASRSELPEGDLPATSLSEVLEPEVQPASTPEEELRQIEEVQSTVVGPDVPPLDQAKAAKRLQDLKLTTEAGKKGREKLWEADNPLYPPTIVRNVMQRVYLAQPQGAEGLKGLYDEIEQIENLGLVLGERDRDRLKQCKAAVLERFVQKSVQFLAANVNKKSMSSDEQSRFDRLAGMLESMEKRPDFKRILAPLSETRQLYSNYRKAAKRT